MTFAENNSDHRIFKKSFKWYINCLNTDNQVPFIMKENSKCPICGDKLIKDRISQINAELESSASPRLTASDKGEL